MIGPGTYLAKSTHWGIKEAKSGSLQCLVTFKIENSDETITWYGSLKEGKGREITLKALLNCGLRGTDLNAFSEGPLANALDTKKIVELVVGDETDPQGVVRTKVQWVNRAGGSDFRNIAPPQDAKAKLKAMNIKADIVALRQELGIKDRPNIDEDDDFLRS